MLNICIVFFVSGLWHGAAWTFVIWGAMHGVYQVIGHFTKKPREAFWRAIRVDPAGKPVRMLKRIGTFLLVAFSWIFFRANNFEELGVLLSKLFTDWTFSLEYFKGTLDHMELTVLGAVISVLSLLVMRRMDIDGLDAPVSKDGVKRAQLGVRYVYIVWIVLLAWMILALGDGASAFIYFQF
jgi:D-alanyl-lipoteichoic acid acyltransferase DltB (MBOAT superfamily)